MQVMQVLTVYVNKPYMILFNRSKQLRFWLVEKGIVVANRLINNYTNITLINNKEQIRYPYFTNLLLIKIRHYIHNCLIILVFQKYWYRTQPWLPLAKEQEVNLQQPVNL